MGKCNCNIPKHLIIIDDSYTLQAFERFKRFPSISTNRRAEYKSKVRKLSKWRLILRFARSIVRGCSWKRAVCLNIELKIDTSDTYLACPDEGCIGKREAHQSFTILYVYMLVCRSRFFHLRTILVWKAGTTSGRNKCWWPEWLMIASRKLDRSSCTATGKCRVWSVGWEV